MQHAEYKNMILTFRWILLFWIWKYSKILLCIQNIYYPYIQKKGFVTDIKTIWSNDLILPKQIILCSSKSIFCFMLHFFSIKKKSVHYSRRFNKTFTIYIYIGTYSRTYVIDCFEFGKKNLVKMMLVVGGSTKLGVLSSLKILYIPDLNNLFCHNFRHWYKII